MAKTRAPERRRMTAILDELRAELEAIPRERFVTINVQRERVLELTDIMLDSFARYEPELGEELGAGRARQRREELGRLALRAQAYYAADLLAEEAYANEQGRNRRALYQRVAEHDRTLMKWARPLFGDDPERAAVLDSIQSGTGRQDDADDVIRLVGMFRGNWSEAAGQTPITEDILNEAEADATQMLEELSGGAPDQARELARRAYTAWYSDYKELMALGRYLARDEPDAPVRFPGVYPARSGAGRRAGEPPAEPDAGSVVAASGAAAASDAAGKPESKA